MKITDEKLMKMIRKVCITELEESIEQYPDNEREGRSDIEFVRDEVDWIVYKYETDGWVPNEDLQEARYILRKTNYGKRMPLYFPSMEPMYRPWQIEDAKRTVNEYARLKRLQKKLEEMYWDSL